MSVHDSEPASWFPPRSTSRQLGVSRRDFLATAAGISGAIAAGGLAVDALAATAAPRPMKDLFMLDAVELSKAISSKQVSCREVMAAYLDHIAHVNPKVNAIVSLQDPGDLLKQAPTKGAAH